MEIAENILNIIHERCSPAWQLELLSDQVIINLPELKEDFRSAFNKAKQEIQACVKQYIPERDNDILFEIRTGSWNGSFKLKGTGIA